MSLSIVMQNMINAILDDIESCAILVGSYRHKCFDKPSPLKLLCSFPINDKIVESRRIFTRFNLNSSRKTIIKILNFRQSAHPLYSPTLLPGDPFQPENLLNSPPNLVQFASIFFCSMKTSNAPHPCYSLLSFVASNRIAKRTKRIP